MVFLFIAHLTQELRNKWTVLCSFLRVEWRYLNQGEVPPDLPIAERIWKNLPRRIEEKSIAVNLFHECLIISVSLFICYFSIFFSLANMPRIYYYPEPESYTTDIVGAIVNSVLSYLGLAVTGYQRVGATVQIHHFIKKYPGKTLVEVKWVISCRLVTLL